MAAAPPAETVTFICTVGDSSGRRNDRADAVAETLELRLHRSGHHRATGRYVFVISGAGLAAAFPTAVDAAEAAVEFQLRILTDRDRPGFGIRLGLHTGQAEPVALLRGRMTLQTLGEQRLHMSANRRQECGRPARAHPLPA